MQELVLRTDGFGSARFGAEPEGVIAYVTSILGGNTGDTGWVDPFTFAACQGTVARRVDWGVLSLLFTDLSLFATERRHFVGLRVRPRRGDRRRAGRSADPWRCHARQSCGRSARRVPRGGGQPR